MIWDSMGKLGHQWAEMVFGAIHKRPYWEHKRNKPEHVTRDLVSTQPRALKYHRLQTVNF
jgi:hypothetical protein